MDNYLSQILKELEQRIAENSYSVKTNTSTREGNSYSVDIDGNGYIGTICYWPDTTFEFQFNDAGSGIVAVLETHEFSSYNSFRTYFENILFNRLISS